MKRVISATEFKAKCLALLDEVAASGETLTVTKRGVPVATLGPPPKKKRRSQMGVLEGKMKIKGDIVNFSFADDWEMVREEEALKRRGS